MHSLVKDKHELELSINNIIEQFLIKNEGIFINNVKVDFKYIYEGDELIKAIPVSTVSIEI